METSLPPCIVLGVDTQIGLNIIRELGKFGIPVIGTGSHRHSMGMYSRFLKKGIVIANRDSEAINTLRKLGEELGACVLIAISEHDIQWLLENRDALGAIRPVLPPATAFHIVLDKHKTLEFAQQQGIEVPKDFSIASPADIDTLIENVSFPVILKWANPHSVMASLRSCGLEFKKIEYANSRDELVQIIERYKPIGQWPLIQQFCPGYGLGQFFYMHKGEAIRFFQHKRVREWPPEGGFSSACDAVPADRHRELQQKSVALLRQIGWEGVAMVEYRYDPRQDRAVLMEVNGRYWGSFPLAVQCHAGFALISYCLAANVPLPDLPRPIESFRSRNIITDSKRLIRILWQAGKIQDKHFSREPINELCQFIGDFFRPNAGYFVWSWDDPVPFFADVTNGLRNLLARFRGN